jgi:hypothetical protein
MIIDIHGHTNAPPSLYAYKAGLTASRGAHGKGNPGLNEEAMGNPVKNHLANNLDKVGTDIQFLSPRPFQLMHSEKPQKIVHYCVQANNDAIAMSVELLVRIVGSDRCMFGTENPGTGSYKDPQTGKMLDDLKPVIEGIASVTTRDRQNIFEDVAKSVFPRFKV